MRRKKTRDQDNQEEDVVPELGLHRGEVQSHSGGTTVEKWLLIITYHLEKYKSMILEMNIYIAINVGKYSIL